MKKSVKIATMAMLVMMVVLSSTMVFAAPDPSTYNGSGATVDTTKVNTLGQNVISIISTIGSIASVIVLVILGIKYMMGSAEEKAEYKKTLIPYILGAVLVFAAATIASIVFSVANQSWV